MIYYIYKFRQIIILKIILVYSNFRKIKKDKNKLLIKILKYKKLIIINIKIQILLIYIKFF